jgi:dihydropteroate synthase
VIHTWKAGRFDLAYNQGNPLVMGIVNVTPDSFSDGGKTLQTSQAIQHALKLLDEGANILDVGGESTRPGSTAISPQEEWSRVVDVLREIQTWKVPLSIDTRKASVMAKALDLGVDILNDVNGFRDEGASQLLAQSHVGAVVMHMRGEPGTMQDSPVYDDVVTDVQEYLIQRIQLLENQGIHVNRILVDPGFGFGKTLQHNIELMRAIPRFSTLGSGVCVGVSRKRMIAEITGQTVPALRLAGSLSAALYAAQQGAAVLRVHDVRETVDSLRVWGALQIKIDYLEPT